MGMHNSLSASMGMPDPFQMLNGMSTMAPFGGTSSFHQHHHISPTMQSFTMSSSPAAHSYSHFSSSVVTNDEYGPQIYQTSSISRTAPGILRFPSRWPIITKTHASHVIAGGVKETRSSVRDSRSGLHQMSIGHHLNERAHVRQRVRNYYTGAEEHNDEYVNLDEAEAPEFDYEWQRRAQRFNHSGYRNGDRHRAIRSTSPPIEVLALPSSSVSEPQPIITEPDDEPSSPPPRCDSRNKKSRSKRESKSKPYKKRARFD